MKNSISYQYFFHKLYNIYIPKMYRRKEHLFLNSKPTFTSEEIKAKHCSAYYSTPSNTYNCLM